MTTFITFITGIFIVSSFTFDDGKYNILFENCPGSSSCKTSSFNISYRGENSFQLSLNNEVLLKAKIECRQHKELEVLPDMEVGRNAYFCDVIGNMRIKK